MCKDVCADAVRAAAIETLLNVSVFPSELAYSIEEIFERALPAEELPDQPPNRKKSP